jgi:hypothetical protein
MPDLRPELSSKRASQLVQDVSTVPSIIGALGLAIADAQKAFNVDYLDSVERILAMAKRIAKELPAPLSDADQTKLVGLRAKANPSDAEKKELAALAAREFAADRRQLIDALLSELAPSRYQFTETSISVRLDLARQFKIGGSLGIGAGFGAVAVTASMTLGYSSDYRGSAEIRSVLHAMPTDNTLGQSLLAQVERLDDKILALPPGAQVDSEMVKKAHELAQKIMGD